LPTGRELAVRETGIYVSNQGFRSSLCRL